MIAEAEIATRVLVSERAYTVGLTVEDERLTRSVSPFPAFVYFNVFQNITQALLQESCAQIFGSARTSSEICGSGGDIDDSVQWEILEG